MSKTVFMRGLQNFIQDIRGCQNKEQEQKRVEKELAKIREKFGEGSAMSGYDSRKYVWKLLYIHMLGYNINFGHKQACDLIPKPKYKDKQVGYMACSILLHENDDFLRLAINGVHQDLISRNEAFECLALSFAGSVGGRDMAEGIVPDILKLLSNGSSRPLVKKRAALCLLRMIRKTPAEQQVVNADSFCSILNGLLEENNLGLLLSTVTLLAGILARNGPVGYEPCQPRLIRIMERLTAPPKDADVGPEYLYYGLPTPWLQAKCLRALQYYSVPEQQADRVALVNILQAIVDNPLAAEGSKGFNPNKSNAVHAVMFEAITLSLHLDTEPKLLASSVEALGRFLTTKEPNIKYLTLETLSRLATQPDVISSIRQHRPTVSAALKDADISIRKRALDLLFSMCDQNNATEIVGELLAYLLTADFTMKEDLVLKIAILAEKFAPNVQWYVDTALTLLERAGDFVSDDIWQRAIQLVTNNEPMQQYAARNIVHVLRRGGSYESLVCTAAYLLGEYGRLIQSEVPPAEQFRLLHERMPTSSQVTKGLLLTAFIKIYLMDPKDSSMRNEVLGLFERNKKLMDAELQQRASEYLVGLERGGRVMRREGHEEGHGLSYEGELDVGSSKDHGPTLPLTHVPAPPLYTPDPGSLTLTSPPGPPYQALAANPQAATSNYILPMPKWPERESTLLRQLQKREGADEDVAFAAAAAGSGSGGWMSTADPSMMTSVAPLATLQQHSSVDLLGGSLSPSVGIRGLNGAADASFGMTSAVGVTSAAPSNPVDLLSDLFSDANVSSPPVPAAQAPAAYPAPAPLQAAQSYPPVPFAPAPLQAAQSYPPPPQPYVPAAPIVAKNSNPFAVAWPGAALPPPIPAVTYGYSEATTTSTTTVINSAMAPPLYGQVAATTPSTLTPAFSGSMAQKAVVPPSTLASAYAGSMVQPTVPPSALTPAFSGSSAPAMDDPFGDAAFGPPPTPVPVFEPAQAIGDLQVWFNALLYKDRGVLYEDQYIQVGVQAVYSGGSCGDFVLFLGNKNTEHSLQQLTVIATSSSSVQAVVTAQAPPQMAPKLQIQVPIKLTCLGPVIDTPSVTLSYTLGNVAVRQELRIPVANHRFVVPEPGILKELFFEQWKMNGNPPNKAQEMVMRETPLTSESIIEVMRQANLGVEHGYLDPSPYNEAGAGHFFFGVQGTEQRALVMCRVEGNPQNMSQFRVTVVSTMPGVATTTKDLIVTRLTSLPPSQ